MQTNFQRIYRTGADILKRLKEPNAHRGAKLAFEAAINALEVRKIDVSAAIESAYKDLIDGNRAAISQIDKLSVEIEEIDAQIVRHLAQLSFLDEASTAPDAEETKE
jgi:ribosomal protein L20A (L18A)